MKQDTPFMTQMPLINEIGSIMLLLLEYNAVGIESGNGMSRTCCMSLFVYLDIWLQITVQQPQCTPLWNQTQLSNCQFSSQSVSTGGRGDL